MFKAEAAICGVSFNDITQDPLRFDALADLLGCEGLHVIRDSQETLISAVFPEKPPEDRADLQRKLLLRSANPALETLVSVSKLNAESDRSRVYG